MLSKSDKQWLEKTIREVVTEVLTVEVQMERFNKEKGMKEFKIEKLFMPNAWVEYLPDHIGAIRGMQKDVNKSNNRALETKEIMRNMAGVILNLTESLRTIAEYSDNIKSLPKNVTPEKLKLDYIDEEVE